MLEMAVIIILGVVVLFFILLVLALLGTFIPETWNEFIGEYNDRDTID